MGSHQRTSHDPSNPTRIDDGKRHRPSDPRSVTEDAAARATAAMVSSDEQLAPFSENEKTVISSDTPLSAAVVPIGLHPSELGELLAGEQLGDLQLEEFIGGGGMGAVFRAVDTKLQRNVAVKILSTHQAGDEETARRFEVEAKSAARLDHPHIARVHYVGEDRGVPYIVFEYIEGTNLRDVVSVTGPLPLPDAIDYTLQIADALSHAWQREVTHRDIKPSNILITADGQAKLVDMGLARVHHVDQTEHELTASGVTLGTFDYISPEQARSPKNADTRSDIYSLGCTFYFMLTGRPPFSGGTALQKLLQHHSDDPPSLRQFRTDVPDSVCTLVATMLAKRVEDRFQNPVDLVAALVALAEPLGIGHAPIALPAVWPDAPPQETWLARNLPWVLPVLLLPIGVFLMEYLSGSTAQPRRFPENAPASAPNTATGGALTPLPLDEVDPGGVESKEDGAVDESAVSSPAEEVAPESPTSAFPAEEAPQRPTQASGLAEIPAATGEENEAVVSPKGASISQAPSATNDDTEIPPPAPPKSP